MSARRILVVAGLLVLPGLLAAQGGIKPRTTGKAGKGGGDGTTSTETSVRTKIDKDVGKGGPRKDPFSTKDLQKENMVALILDKKKDLKLSDDEVKALKDISDRLKDTVKSPMKSLDSLSSELKRGKPDQQDRIEARVFGPQYLAEVRFQYDAFLKEALAKLTEEHQKSANLLVEERRKELAEEKEKGR